MNHINRVLNVGLLASALMLTGCANFQTVGRTTDIPARVKKNDSNQSKNGRAIHLDAQQRLVIVNSLGKYCAEPSPDGLAAYAASLGLGVSNPTQVGGSLSQSLQSSAASIGLRTQSITLMRDALYRICEAQSNGTVTDEQATLLLRRSQDLTAVIVAVEQLTGAVTAQQVILNQSNSASSGASLFANQQAIEQIESHIEQLKKDVKSIEDEIAVLNAKPESNEKKEALKLKYEQLNFKKDQLEQYNKILAATKAKQDSSITMAYTSQQGSGDFSDSTVIDNIDKDSVIAISGAVESMVREALGKAHTLDTCLVVYASNKKINPNMSRLCDALIEREFAFEMSIYSTKADLDVSNEVRMIVGGKEGKDFFENWKKNNQVDSDAASFINNPDFKTQRAIFLSEYKSSK